MGGTDPIGGRPFVAGDSRAFVRAVKEIPLGVRVDSRHGKTISPV